MINRKRSWVVWALIAAMVLGSWAWKVDASAEGRSADVGRPLNDDSERGIDRIVISGKPPALKVKVASVLESVADAEANVISNVPAFDWSYGCSATSAAMLFGYYDNSGYPDMYVGPENGGVCPMTNAAWGVGESPLSASHAGIDGRAGKGHVDDYWVAYGSTSTDPYIGNWNVHSPSDCTADFMGTNQSKYGNSDGSTTFFLYKTSGAPLYDYIPPDPNTQRDGCHGLRLFAEFRGYTVETNFSQRIAEDASGGFTFEQFKTEIDAGRPVLIHVTNHTMLGYGYSTTGRTIQIRDTWDYSSHTMTWGGTYSADNLEHYAVTVIRLGTGTGYTLATTASPSAGGSVTKDPLQTSYVSGTVVTLTATPGPGYTFTGWSGDLSGTTNPTTITMTSNKTVTAVFTALPSYTLTTTALPSAGGTVVRSPDQPSYLSGTLVTLTATPGPGYTFTGWSGSLTGTTNPTTITMTNNKTVTAVFTALPTYTLTTTASPLAGGSIGRSPNAASYVSDTVVTLTATPATGYTFTSWSGSLTGTTNPTIITMTANKTVTATFSLNTYTITPSAGAGGTITPSTPQIVSQGGNLTFTITPSTGYHIEDVLVDGSTVGALSSYPFTNVQASHTIAASFAINTYTLTYTAGANGSITGTSPQTVNYGGSGTQVTAVPNLGSSFVKWSDDVMTASRTDTNVTANKTVTATFSLNTYTITPSAGAGGTITPSTPQIVSQGGNLTFTITPSTGYHIEDVLVDGSTVGALSSYPFTNVQASHTIAASFAINAYTLTYTAGANGSITGTSPQTVNYGGSGTQVTAVPNLGSSFVKWSDDVMTASRTDTNVTANKTVTATFSLNTYTITPSAGAGGTITPSTPQIVSQGGNLTFTITPSTGYHIEDVLVDGSTVGALSSYPFTNVQASHTIAASFAINAYTLTYTAGANGSITGTSPQTVNYGGSGTQVTAVPNLGSSFVKWSDDVMTASRTDTNVTANKTVTATFSLNTYTITPSAGAGGTITPSTPQIVSQGGNLTFTITPSTGYHIEDVLVDGSTVGALSSYPFTNVQASHTIAASFAINAYTLTYTAGANGSITGTSPQTVNYGGSGTQVTAVPNLGSSFVKWSDDVMTASRTDTNVTANKTVTATFSLNTYTITPSAGAGGTITPSTPQIVSQGGNLTFTITPSTGYHIEDVLVDGSTVGALSSYPFTNVQASHTIAASFAINTYTLTYTAGANGSITGTSPQTVNYGGSGTQVTAVPNLGSSFVKWSDDVMTASRTDTNVTANKTVTATFSLNTYTITPSAGAGGTITPSTPQIVSQGGNLTFTITPSTGYHIEDVLVDGSTVGALSSYPFTNVQASHTIAASFAPDAPAPDMGMHITSPLEGASLTGGTFTVAGTFDTSRSGTFKLVVTIPTVGTHTYLFTLPTPSLTWGPVSISRTDFPGLVSGATYSLTLQGVTELPSIPPCQTGLRTVTWQVQDTVSFTLPLLPSWNVIAVPFPTPVSLLPTCDLFLAWDGSLWQMTTTLLPGTGYLVRNTAGATTVSLTGTPSSSPQTQPATGTWQIIGNPYTTPASFACTSSVPYLLSWDGSLWQLVSPTNLPPGLGFLLQASSPGTLTLTRLP